MDNDENIQSAAAVPRTSALWITSRRMRMSREETLLLLDNVTAHVGAMDYDSALRGIQGMLEGARKCSKMASEMKKIQASHSCVKHGVALHLSELEYQAMGGALVSLLVMLLLYLCVKMRAKVRQKQKPKIN